MKATNAAAGVVVLVLAGCGGGSSGPRYTAENQKAKVEKQLVSADVQKDGLNAQFPDPSTIKVVCVAATQNTLNCTINDPEQTGAPIQATVTIDPQTGQEQTNFQ